jgi:hypothetical protein
MSCREEDNLSEAIDQAASHKKGKVTDTKLTPEQLEEVRCCCCWQHATVNSTHLCSNFTLKAVQIGSEW